MGESILVTGALGGMGKATVKALVDKGYHVFALDNGLGTATDHVTFLHADVTSEESLLLAFETVSRHTDSLRAIIHFAGIYMLDSLVEMKKSDIDKIFSVNVVGAFLVNKTFLPLLKKEARILITTSELAPLDPLPFTGIYAVTKSALDKYAYSLRMELQLLGINVSVLRSGAVSTNMLGVSTDALDRFCSSTNLYSCNAARFKRIVDRVEARGISPEAIADKVTHIISKRRPRFSYSVNRNPLLLLLSALPKSFQFLVIKLILK